MSGIMDPSTQPRKEAADGHRLHASHEGGERRVMRSLRALPVRFPWLATALLVTGMIAAAATYLLVQHEREAAARAAFAAYANDIGDQIDARLRAYGDVLYALRGLFNASSGVTRVEFRRFVEGVAVHDRYPGLLNLSYARFVPHAERAAFEREVRRETGFADFSITPPGDRAAYDVLIYFEPPEGRRPAFGLDLSPDAARRAVVESARDSGTITASGPLTLLRDRDSNQTSVLLRLAVYRGAAAPASAEERRRNYQGVVGAAINVGALLRAALPESHFQRARIALFDAGPGAAGRDASGTLLFDSAAPPDGAAAPARPADTGGFVVARRLAIGDRAWRLEVSPLNSAPRFADRVLPLATAAVMAIITLLLHGLMRALAEAESQATHDILTGLHNRQYMQEWLALELKRALRHRRPIGAILCDLDHFKRVNDSYGHDAGDMVLREVAALLRRNTRDSDVACRYGGEEFLVLMPESPLEATLQRAERLREAVAALALHYGGQSIGPVTLSAGVAVYPEDGADQDGLLRAADAALYQAKQEGRNRVARLAPQPALKAV